MTCLRKVKICGKNCFPCDLKRLQHAVDNYDIVQLKGTFNFGSDGSLKIDKNVVITGSLSRVPVIKGGKKVFVVDNKDVNVQIEGIHFDGGSRVIINPINACNVEIKNCKITNVQNSEIINEEGVIMFDAVAIQFGPLRETFPRPGPTISDAHVKNACVLECYIDMGKYVNGVLVDRNPNPGNFPSYPSRGISAYSVAIDNCVVAKNTSLNTNRINLDFPNVSGNFSFDNNVITMDPFVNSGAQTILYFSWLVNFWNRFVGGNIPISPGKLTGTFTNNNFTMDAVSATELERESQGIFLGPGEVSDVTVCNNVFNIERNAVFPAFTFGGQPGQFQGYLRNTNFSSNTFNGSIKPFAIDGTPGAMFGDVNVDPQVQVTLTKFINNKYRDTNIGDPSPPFAVLLAAQYATVQNESAIITNAFGDGVFVTYTAINDFFPGQVVNISNITPPQYNINNAIITSSTENSFVVESNAVGVYVPGSGVATTNDEVLNIGVHNLINPSYP